MYFDDRQTLNCPDRGFLDNSSIPHFLFEVFITKTFDFIVFPSGKSSPACRFSSVFSSLYKHPEMIKINNVTDFLMKSLLNVIRSGAFCYICSALPLLFSSSQSPMKVPMIKSTASIITSMNTNMPITVPNSRNPQPAIALNPTRMIASITPIRILF